MIQKIKENNEKARFHEEINMSSDDGGSENEDESKHFWISPLIEEENKENNPKFTKIIAMPKLSKLEISPKYHMNSIVSQELDRFETERQLEVEAKVFERRKRFSMDFDAERQPRTEAATAAAAAPHGTKYGTQYKEDSIGHGAPIRLA